MVTRDHGDFVFFAGAQSSSGIITLSQEEWTHLTRVRRRRENEEVFASDGKGIVCRCRILTDGRLEVIEELCAYGELPFKLTLVCGILQGDSARDVVTAAVPLGVSRIIWVRMERSQESYSDSKLEKLNRVAIQSLKQCGRACLPDQVCVLHLTEAVKQIDNHALWIAQMSDSPTRSNVAVNDSDLALVVGPEGGFANRELELLTDAGGSVLHLGSRRLRSELAVAAGLSAILCRTDAFTP